MFEVQSTARPGRPALLTTLTALTLAGALGGAYVQVREARALGNEVRIGDGPLLVRPPRGWVQDRRDPNTFVLWLAEQQSGPGLPKRAVTFRYGFTRTTEDAEDVLRRWVPAASRTAPTPAAIGGIEGVQVVAIKQIQFRGRVYQVQTRIRVAISLEGDIVSVEYTPLSGFTPADSILLEDICGAVRLDDFPTRY